VSANRERLVSASVPALTGIAAGPAEELETVWSAALYRAGLVPGLSSWLTPAARSSSGDRGPQKPGNGEHHDQEQF
jgi:hypothetical protein